MEGKCEMPGMCYKYFENMKNALPFRICDENCSL